MDPDRDKTTNRCWKFSNVKSSKTSSEGFSFPEYSSIKLWSKSNLIGVRGSDLHNQDTDYNLARVEAV